MVGPGQVCGEQAGGEGVVLVQQESRLGPREDGGGDAGHDDDSEDGGAEEYHERVRVGEAAPRVEGGEPPVLADCAWVHGDVDEREYDGHARCLQQRGDEAADEEQQRLRPLAGGEDLVELADGGRLAGGLFGGRTGCARGGVVLCGGCLVARLVFAHANTPFSVRRQFAV